MKYAVEARIMNNNIVTTKVRPVDDGERECCRETEKCDIWTDIFDILIDIFDTEQEARAFAREYKNV